MQATLSGGQRIEPGKTLVSHAYRKTSKYLIAGFQGADCTIQRVKMESKGRVSLLDEKPKIAEVVHLSYFGKLAQELVTTPASVKENSMSLDAMEANPFIDKNLVALFRSLETQMDPERLTCDGERSRSEVAARRKELLRKWELLESFFGQKVAGEKF